MTRSLPILTVAAILTGGIVLAQTTPAPTLTLASFTEESLISPDQLVSPDAPTLPDDIVSAVQNGQVEVHQILSYNGATSTLTVSLMAFTPGTAIPSPVGAAGATVYSYTVNVKNITVNESAAVLSGSISSAQGSGGLVAGGLMTVTAGYIVQGPDATGAISVVFTSVNVSVAGVGSLQAKSGMGVFKPFQAASKLPMAVAGPKGETVTTPSFTLSGSDSNDPNGGSLIYQWALIPTAGQNVTIAGANTATPMVTIASEGAGSPYGPYTFQLSVTNAAGLASIDTVTVNYSSGR